MIKITRSFSRKIQVKQFEPADCFCGAEMVVDEKDKEKVSEQLDVFVQKEVMKSIEKLRPSLIKESGPDKKKVEDVSVDEAEHDTELEV